MSNQVQERNVVLVAREGLTVRNMDNAGTVFHAESSVVGLLTALIDTLENIKLDSEGLEDILTTVYVPTMLGGIVNKTIGNYIRTGCTREGNVIDPKELELYKKAFTMINQRAFNIRVVFAPKENANIKALVKKTWSMLDREERKLLMAAKVGAVSVPVIGGVPAQPQLDMTAMQAEMQKQMNDNMMAMQQQFMTMMQGMMGGMMNPAMMQNMQMQQPVTPVQTPEPIVQDLEAPTTLNVNVVGQPAEQSNVEVYEPEF